MVRRLVRPQKKEEVKKEKKETHSSIKIDPVCRGCGIGFKNYNSKANAKGFCKRKCASFFFRKKDSQKKKYKSNYHYEKVPDSFYFSREWRELRYKALKIHGRKCLVCGAQPPEVILHVDHIKPMSKYPQLRLKLDNLQILCEDCNIGKSNKDETDWRTKDQEELNTPEGNDEERK